MSIEFGCFIFLVLEVGKLFCEDFELDDDFDVYKVLEEDDEFVYLGLGVDVVKGDDELGILENLEMNDFYLDDLFNGDEFDLLVYIDFELDIGDKKDIFNEYLRLVELVNEKVEWEVLLCGVELGFLGFEECFFFVVDVFEFCLVFVFFEVKFKVEEGGCYFFFC